MQAENAALLALGNRRGKSDLPEFVALRAENAALRAERDALLTALSQLMDCLRDEDEDEDDVYLLKYDGEWQRLAIQADAAIGAAKKQR